MVPDYIITIIRAILTPSKLLFLKPTFYFDGLATNHVVDFMNSDRFLFALNLGKKYEENRDDYYRLYIGCALADHAAKLNGDFVECGVFLGTMSKTIISYISFNSLPKTFYLIDTFSGIPAANILESDGRESMFYRVNRKAASAISSDFPNYRVPETGFITKKNGEQYFLAEGEKKDTKHGRGNKFASEIPPIIDLVKKKFEKDNVKIVQGLVPGILETISFSEVAFLHIDMNNAYPEVECIRYYWNKIVTGGIVLLDDYAYSIHYQDSKNSIDELGKDLNFSVITLPTGQGLIIKY